MNMATAWVLEGISRTDNLLYNFGFHTTIAYSFDTLITLVESKTSMLYIC
jgi:hypothetical protein